MKTVSQATFDRKVQDGEWEATTDVNQFGRVDVRNTSNGSRFTVTVSKRKTFRTPQGGRKAFKA
jgi:hypothetical protein